MVLSMRRKAEGQTFSLHQRGNFSLCEGLPWFLYQKANFPPTQGQTFCLYRRTNLSSLGKANCHSIRIGKKSVFTTPPPPKWGKTFTQGRGTFRCRGGGVGWPLEEGQMFLLFRGETEHRILLHSPPSFWCLRKNPPTRKIELAPPSPSILKKMGQKRRGGG